MARFVDEVDSGDRMRGLVALRHELATAIEGGAHVCDECGAMAPGATAKDLAALALRLERVLETIEQIGGNDEEIDDLAAKRLAKLRAAPGA